MDHLPAPGHHHVNSAIRRLDLLHQSVLQTYAAFAIPAIPIRRRADPSVKTRAPSLALVMKRRPPRFYPAFFHLLEGLVTLTPPFVVCLVGDVHIPEPHGHHCSTASQQRHPLCSHMMRYRPGGSSPAACCIISDRVIHVENDSSPAFRQLPVGGLWSRGGMAEATLPIIVHQWHIVISRPVRNTKIRFL
jgi:hypothetical protein